MTPTTELAEKLGKQLDELRAMKGGPSKFDTQQTNELIDALIRGMEAEHQNIEQARTLRKQAEELERCRTALRPFAYATLLGQSALIVAGDGITQAFDSGKKHVTVIMEDDAAEAFNAARSAYNEPKQNGEAK